MPSEVSRCQAEDDREDNDVGQIDDDEGEDDTIFLQIGLVAWNHPQRPHEMKGPGGSNEEVEGFIVVGDIGGHLQQGGDEENDHGPERHKVGGERDEHVGFIGHDVAAIGCDMDTSNLATAGVDEDGMGQFVA